MRPGLEDSTVAARGHSRGNPCTSRPTHVPAVRLDTWPDDVRLSDIEAQFVCGACGKRGADVRPDFNWNKMPVEMIGFRGNERGAN